MLEALESGHEVGAPAVAPAPVASPSARYDEVRALSVRLCEGLNPDDCQAQSMPDASPLKWHLAHTTWFFETFVLAAVPNYRPFRPKFAALFNSYYHSVGAQHPRAQRGLLTRPSLEEVRAWRTYVDDAMRELLEGGATGVLPARIELGLQHEQQHQELMLTDVKHLLSHNPLKPAYRAGALAAQPRAQAARWIERPGVLVETGHDGNGFGFDNEFPRHRVWLDAYAIASRPVTNADYIEFIHDGAYREPLLWLADGWDRVQAEAWDRPLYWSPDLESHYTLRGEQPLVRDAPVCHLSYYEADAYARWAGARLPREAEWEAAAAAWPVAGNFLDSGELHPRTSAADHPGFFGDVWEWTASAYGSYPGYRTDDGALGEYNSKFMCNQFVLRGGSCVSSADHLRPSYRNFFPPHARWQFSGLRLAKDMG
jgi:ergothioneine biosynthesis protein EgtB